MNNENQWATPTPLRGNRSNLIDFPVNALPPILREMAYAISRTTLSDVSMAATSILSSVSYCFSGQFRIVGKKDHSEPLVIDSLIVAEASFKKSPVMKLVAKPYQDYVQEYNEKNKALILENQAKKKVIANKLAALEKKADADTKEMSDLAMELSSITNADFHRIIVDDITPESLVRQLAINGTLLMMLTIKESAALISGLSEHTVRQLVKQGKVKSVRTGEGRNGKILVNKADLIAYFNGKGV